IPGKVFVVGVILLISFIAYSSQLFLFLPAYGWWTWESAMTLLPLNALVGMVFYNYYLAVTTDPGKIPAYWVNKVASEGVTGPRFCKSCAVYKPPRSHHCRYCKRCVLKMDHHCPWINNCVGHNNYGHFVRFIIFANTACIYVLVLLVARVRYILSAIRHFQYDAEPSMTQVVFMVLNFILAFIVVFCVGVLTVYQLYCMSRNQTNIEAWERGKVETLIKRGKILPVQYPFDIGLYQNICNVLGPKPLLWLWPKQMQGDGLSFPVIHGTDPRLPFYWPPRDPDDLRPSIFSSKYKRQQEKQQLLREDPNAIVEESEGYYDSGSFVTDSENEYSLDDEEEGMRKLVNNNLYDLSGTYYDDQPTNQYRRPSNHRDISSGDDSDDDDTIPLSSFTTRKKIPSSKED
ncbi:DHHC palmitoyltransferase-domain-containing protein, partial [Mucor mucedo]|uniref:DHHC palmitoyltransferase-domain-containing protein n=1 Tax=Mucor mucedo TaxID=29922 RepID=UPI0022207F13